MGFLSLRGTKGRSLSGVPGIFRGWEGNLPFVTQSFLDAQVIFRFALALFKYKEEEILKLLDSTSIFKYLRSFTRTVLDAR